MDTSGYVIFGVAGAVAYIVICGLCATSIAVEKGRPQAEGFLYGLLAGPVGILIEACLPARKKGGE